MNPRQRRRRPGPVRRAAAWVVRLWCWCAARVSAGWRALASRLRPWRPVVVVDARRPRARRLRRAVTRATQAHLRALGVAPPAHLLIVVQRTVTDDHPRSTLLQVYEDAHGVRRHVLFLALVVAGQSLSDGEIVATLRQQLHQVVGEALGRLACSVALDGAPARVAAPVVPLHRVEEPPPFDDAPPPEDEQAWSAVNDGAFAVAAER